MNIEFENEITAEEAREILRESPGVVVIDKRDDGGYITPIESVGESPPTSRAFVKTRRLSTASRSGWSVTTSAKAPRSTPYKSPNSCSTAASSSAWLRLEFRRAKVSRTLVLPPLGEARAEDRFALYPTRTPLLAGWTAPRRGASAP